MVLSPFDEQTESQFGGGGSSVLAQIREAERRAGFARIAEDARRRAAVEEAARLEREAAMARQLAAFRAEQRRQQLERERRIAAEAAAKGAADAARQAKIDAERPLPRDRTPRGAESTRCRATRRRGAGPCRA